MFPLNEQPQGFWALLERFKHGVRIKEFVRQQLVAGATAALACVRAHYVSLDFAKIGHGAPRYLDGGVEDLRPHYDVVEAEAQNIVALIERGTEMKLEHPSSPLMHL
jgi:hypothetical protein